MAKPGKNLVSEKEIFDYLMTKPGMTEIKAAGIVANIAKESMYYSDAVQMGDVENPGIGLFQYTLKSRKDAFLEAIPDWKTNWRGQIDFAFEENEFKSYMEQPYNSVQDSTRGFMTIFEKPKDQSEEEVQDRVDRLYKSKNIQDDLKDLPKENLEKQIQEGIQSEKEEAEKFGYKLEDWKALNNEQRNQIRKQFNLVNPKPKKRDGTTNSPFLMVPDSEAEEGKFYENNKGLIYIFKDGQYQLEGEYKGPEETPRIEGEKEDVIVLDPSGKERIITQEKTKPGVRVESIDATPTVESPLDNLSQPLNLNQTQNTENKTTTQTAEETNVESTQEQNEEKPSLNLSGQLGDVLKAASNTLDSIGGPSTIISYILGKKGLTDAMKEITPQKRAELSPLFYQHLRQSRELAKKGFHPAEERAIQKEIDNAYRIGLDNAVRGTGGDRAKFLAQSGILDSKRSSALLEVAAQDAELRRQNQDSYADLMMFKENYDQQRSEQERTEDMQMQLANKQAATQFTSQALSNVLSGVSGNSSIMRQIMNNYLSGSPQNNLGLVNQFEKKK